MIELKTFFYNLNLIIIQQTGALHSKRYNINTNSESAVVGN